MIRHVTLALAMLVGTAFTASARAEEPTAQVVAASESYQVDGRDVLELIVYDEAELSGTLTVAEQGMIDVPLLGPVDVNGLTTLEIARKIESALGEKFLVDPHVTVRVTAYGSKEIKVLGAVNKPGLYYLTGPTTLLTAKATPNANVATSASGAKAALGADGPATRRPGRSLRRT